MKRKKRSVYPLLVAAIALIIGITALIHRPSSGRPAPTDKGYYTGPMVNKVGDLVTDDGVIVQKGYRPEMAHTKNSRKDN